MSKMRALAPLVALSMLAGSGRANPHGRLLRYGLTAQQWRQRKVRMRMVKESRRRNRR